MDKVWSQKISVKSQNKIVSINTWFTVHVFALRIITNNQTIALPVLFLLWLTVFHPHFPVTDVVPQTEVALE